MVFKKRPKFIREGVKVKGEIFPTALCCNERFLDEGVLGPSVVDLAPSALNSVVKGARRPAHRRGPEREGEWGAVKDRF
jgi:hypothetical protein